MDVIVAGAEHVDDVARLFDQYRVFYEQASDPGAAKDFIATRLDAGDSVILCAVQNDEIVGFTQLYPSFTSVGMRPLWILNDLFVAKSARRRGVGRRLMQAARDHAEQTGAVRLLLETGISNTGAQALYESEGWIRDDEFYRYALNVRS